MATEVRLFTVAKVFAADGDVVAELERVGHSGSSTERFDVLWRVREDTVDIRSHLPPEVAEVFDNGYREHDVEAMPWHALPPPSAVIPPSQQLPTSLLRRYRHTHRRSSSSSRRRARRTVL